MGALITEKNKHYAVLAKYTTTYNDLLIFSMNAITKYLNDNSNNTEASPVDLNIVLTRPELDEYSARFKNNSTNRE